MKVFFISIWIAIITPFFAFCDVSNDQAFKGFKIIEFSIGASMGIGYSRLDYLYYSDDKFKSYTASNGSLANVNAFTDNYSSRNIYLSIFPCRYPLLFI